MKNNYVNAVLALINEGKSFDEITAGLKNTLKTRGHESLYSAILESVLRIIEAKPLETAKVVVAKQADYDKFKQEIEAELKAIAPEATASVSIDDTLIGGYVLEANNLKLDKSYKNSLVNLYRKLTQN